MSTFSFDDRIFTRCINCFLRPLDGSNRLDRNTKNDIFTIGYASKRSSSMIGFCINMAYFICREKIIMLTSFHFCASKTGTDLKSFYCIDTHDRMSENCWEFIKLWISQACRALSDYSTNNTTKRVSFGFGFLNQIDHIFCCIIIWAADDICLNLFRGYFIWIDNSLDITDTLSIGEKFSSKFLPKIFLGYRSGCNTTYHYSCRTATASSGITMAIFEVIGIVRMPRAVEMSKF